MNKADPLRTMLLICRLQKKMYPLSSHGLNRADGPKKSLAKKIEENYIFDVDESVRRIESIIILDYYGSNFFQKMTSAIMKNWIVDLKLSEPIALSLSDIKSMIVDCIPNSIGMDDNWLPDQNSVEAFKKKVFGSPDPFELFRNLQLPSPENALDIL